MTYWETRHEPIVYYMVHENYRGAVKIGTTVNMVNRIDRHRKHRRSEQYFFIAWELGGPEIESKRHNEFREYLIQGEWFFNDGEVKEHIEYLLGRKFTPEFVGDQR